MRKRIREITALLFGLICAVYVFSQHSGIDETTEPIIISLNYFSRVETAGVSIRYTTEQQEKLSDSKKVCSERVFGSKDIEFLISEKNIYQMEMVFDSFPGLIFVKDITINGEQTVKVRDFENISINDIDEFTWDGTKAIIRSEQAHPSILFNKPFNIRAKSNCTKQQAKALIVFFFSSLVFFLVSVLLSKLTGKGGGDTEKNYTTCIVLFSGIVASYAAARLAKEAGSCYEENISISAKVVTEKETILSFKYTTIEDEDFEQKLQLSAGTNEITKELPSKSINKLCIGFEGNPGIVTFENFDLYGENSLSLNDESCFTNNSRADSIQTNKSKIELKPSSENPQIIFQRAFNLRGDSYRNINTVVFYSLFIGILALLTTCFKSVSAHIAQAKAEDITLVFIFLMLCFAPSWFLTDKKISESEKRTLAEFPEPNDTKGLNSSYSQQFETWYSDHFAERELIVETYNKFFQTKGDAQNGSVIEGKDGWYFYKQDHNIENYSNLQIIKDEELPLIKEYLLTIDNWCTAHGKKFYVLICPNKASIYSEKVKHVKKLKDDANSDAMRVLDTLKGTNLKIVFSKDELLRHKNDGELLFRKQDTHHTEIGAYYSHKAIMDIISEDYPLKAIPLSEIPQTAYKDTKNCDLKQLMPGAVPDDTSTYKHLITQKTFITETRIGSSVKYTNPKGKHTLYLLGDSYSLLLQHFFAMEFKEVEVNRRHQYWFTNEELEKIEENTDIVVLEIVERHLSSLSHQSISTKLQPFRPKHKEKSE